MSDLPKNWSNVYFLCNRCKAFIPPKKDYCACKAPSPKSQAITAGASHSNHKLKHTTKEE
jgi:hypothetical protein